jgi:hypothetical protein
MAFGMLRTRAEVTMCWQTIWVDGFFGKLL